MAKEKKPKEINNHPNKIGFKDVAGYTIAEAANMFNLTYITSFLKVFLTNVLGIPSLKVAIMFVVTRLWDVVNDPLWGAIVAKRKPGKDGKFRQYLRLVAVPLGISTVICFLPYSDPNSIFYSATLAENKNLLFAICIVTYLIYCTMYTAMNIPFGSLASVITDDPKGRTVLSTARSLGSGVGGAVVLLIAPMIIYKNNVADGNRMFIYALIMGIMSIAFYLIGHRNVKERVPAFDEESANLKGVYKGLFKSRPFVMITISGVLISGQLQFNSFNSYLYQNYFEDAGFLSTLGTICTYLPMAALMFFTPKLAAKFGKKELCGRMSIIAAAASVFLAITANSPSFISMVNPEGGRYPAWLFMICLFLIGFGYTFVSLTCWAVVMDVIDYQEWKTGVRNESAVYSAYTFGRQFGQAIADAGGLFLLEYIGYSETNKALWPSIQNGEFVPGISEKLLLICTIIPAFVYTGVWLIFKFGYPLTKEKLEPIYADLRRKHEMEEKEASNA